jgi:hypothetical protein
MIAQPDGQKMCLAQLAQQALFFAETIATDNREVTKKMKIFKT